MADAAGDVAMLVLAGKHAGINFGLRMRGGVLVAFECNCRGRDHRAVGKLFLECVEAGFPFDQVQPPAIVMDDDSDMVRVVESRGRAREDRVVELPGRRGGLPDQMNKVVRIGLVAQPATLSGEIELIPSGELGFER